MFFAKEKPLLPGEPTAHGLEGSCHGSLGIQVEALGKDKSAVSRLCAVSVLSSGWDPQKSPAQKPACVWPEHQTSLWRTSFRGKYGLNPEHLGTPVTKPMGRSCLGSSGGRSHCSCSPGRMRLGLDLGTEKAARSQGNGGRWLPGGGGGGN